MDGSARKTTVKRNLSSSLVPTAPTLNTSLLHSRSLCSNNNTCNSRSLYSNNNTCNSLSLCSNNNIGNSRSLYSKNNTCNSLSLCSNNNTCNSRSLCSNNNIGNSSSLCSNNNTCNSSYGQCWRPSHQMPFYAERVYRDRQMLLMKREELRQSIRNVRQSTVEECSKILDSIIGYCECKVKHRPCESKKRRAASCADTTRVGASCSVGGCGGYTPSGWNKLLTLHCLQCEDPNCPCCCPPCPCPVPCPIPCMSCDTYKSSHYPCQEVKHKVRRKPKQQCCIKCKSRLTDENESAINSRPSTKILGELAFQLERRILDHVFGLEDYKRRRFYGYTVNNISQMIDKESKNIRGDEILVRKNELVARFEKLINDLYDIGYDIKIHGDFAQVIVNRYGLLACPPDQDTIDEFGLQNSRCISKLITQLARGEHEASNLKTLLRGLQYMSKCDGRPLFVW